jgi:LacI family transcriptional regulator
MIKILNRLSKRSFIIIVVDSLLQTGSKDRGWTMRKSTNVTQAQIAQKLQLSTVTVSKALRDHTDISKETIQKVKQLAQEMGYTPDLIARALSSRRSNIIGVVVPEIDHTFFSAVMKGIYFEAIANQYQIVLTISHENDQREIENIHTLMAMRVDGILISISEKTHNLDVFNKMKKKRIPLVFFDRVISDPYFSRVVVDDRQGAMRAVEYAISQGYRRIALLAGMPKISITSERTSGYIDALKANGIVVKNDWIISCGFSEEDGYRGFKELVGKNDLPEVVFCVNDPIAIGVYDASMELGLNIPNDIGVIGFSDNIIARYLHPPLTTIMQPAEEIGMSAVRLIMEEIRNPGFQQPKQIVIPTKLIVRESCIKN